MKQKSNWILWICMYVVCFIAGFIPQPTGFGSVLLILLSLGFFVPGGMLLYQAHLQQDKKTLLSIRYISLGSLILTVVLFIANLLSVFSPDLVGSILHVFLAIVSVPMLAIQYWLVSLFLWSCLFIGTFLKFYRQ